jgi:glycosyltransferase involved in cell wall biosynthesis
MRILYLLADFPYPLTNGTRVQTFNLLKYMMDEHECFILSFCNNDGHKWMKDFQRILPRVQILGLFRRRSGLGLQVGRILHLLRGNPVFLARWENNGFVLGVNQALKNRMYDVVHFEGISMTPYLSFCETEPTVLSTIDAVSLAYRRASYSAQNVLKKAYRRFASWCIVRFEHNNLLRATKVHVVSHVDLEYLRSCIPGLDAEDVEIVVPEEIINYPLSDSDSGRQESHQILFWGALNVDGIGRGLLWFLNESYPTILKSFPDVQMVVLGRDAPSNLRKQFECIPNVRYIAWAEDYCAELARSKVIVMPDLSGTGIKNRVLQTMALARPIVGTPLVFEGIPVVDGVHCFERTGAEGFSQAIITLLRETNLRKLLGGSARQLVLSRYTINVAGPKWVSLYKRAIAKFRTGL